MLKVIKHQATKFIINDKYYSQHSKYKYDNEYDTIKSMIKNGLDGYGITITNKYNEFRAANMILLGHSNSYICLQVKNTKKQMNGQRQEPAGAREGGQ